MEKNCLNILIGANLRNKRLEKNLSQWQLAKSLNPPISYQQVQKYEAGTNRISSCTLYAFSQVLECNVLDFYDKADELMKGEAVTIQGSRKRSSEDITIFYEQVPQNYREHLRAIIKGLAQGMEVPQ